MASPPSPATPTGLEYSVKGDLSYPTLTTHFLESSRNLISRGDLGQGLRENTLFPDSVGSPGLNTHGQHRGLKNRGGRCSQAERSWRPP